MGDVQMRYYFVRVIKARANINRELNDDKGIFKQEKLKISKITLT